MNKITTDWVDGSFTPDHIQDIFLFFAFNIQHHSGGCEE